MNILLAPLCHLTRQPALFFGVVIVISVLAVSLAITSEIFLGLEPCVMCIYQRWGFVIAATFAFMGLLVRKNISTVKIAAAFTGLSFLGNAAIAFYHSGVELKWWVSAVEGCTIPDFGDGASGSNQSWIDNIMSTPSKSCDVIAWQDPIFGLSMANYNVILCFGLFAISMIAAFRLKAQTIA